MHARPTERNANLSELETVLNLRWVLFSDDWLRTRAAASLFLLSAVCVVLLYAVLHEFVNLSYKAPFPWNTLGFLVPIGTLFLWIGMWRYWLRVDVSGAASKRVCFVVLLVGFWYGSFLYYFMRYLPDVFRRNRIEA